MAIDQLGCTAQIDIKLLFGTQKNTKERNLI